MPASKSSVLSREFGIVTISFVTPHATAKHLEVRLGSLKALQLAKLRLPTERLCKGPRVKSSWIHTPQCLDGFGWWEGRGDFDRQHTGCCGDT